MRKILRVILTLIGASVGAALVAFALHALTELNVVTDTQPMPFWLTLLSYILFSLAGAVSFFLFSPMATQLFDRTEEFLRTRPMADIVAGLLGLFAGLVIAFLLGQLITLIPFRWLAVTLSILVYVVLGYYGMTLAVHRREEFNLLALLRRTTGRDGKGSLPTGDAEELSRKLLDTSVIIDGRVYEICKAGFLEGRLIVPGFVLDELRAVSDSEDDLKRSRGRRGLDILARLQNELARPVEVMSRDYPELTDVDSKLLKMAAEIDAKVITNDYNLNKVAKVQNISVLNINELSNAVKPIALPGEYMTVKIVKPGKEQGQGVAYLEDGTMIVVEGGSRCIDEAVQITVTSSLQTSAGRMIFGKMV